MDYWKKYESWLNSQYISDEAKIELKNLTKEEIKVRFYKDLEFGTAGLRGKLGLGTNRMNEYTVGKTIQALANVIVSKGEEAKKRGVSIAYDVRHKSEDFALLAARILIANGIKTYLFDNIQSTPIVSYTVRNLNNISGLMITASHNPKEYNGIKIYWEEGSQILDDLAYEISEELKNIKKLQQINLGNLKEIKESDLMEYIGEEIEDKYIEETLNLSINEDIDRDINIVYTPLNGTGKGPVLKIFKKRKFNNIHLVEEQENPDPDFTSVGYPNPEFREAFEYAIKLGLEKDADLLIATDPDADRVAIMVKGCSCEYVFLNGNQTGALLANYILSQKSKKGELEPNSAIVKSIVTSDLAKLIADKYKVKTFETLTGFKNICGKANEFERNNSNKFIFGFEESIGYVYGDIVRDKDAINTSMIIAEMAGYYKKKGKNLLDILEEIYQEFGYYLEDSFSMELTGIEGSERIGRIMESFRGFWQDHFKELNITKIIDYKYDETGNPKSNVLKFYIEDGSWFAIRPSGTEPKLKVYIYSNDKEEVRSLEKLNNIREIVENQLEKIH